MNYKKPLVPRNGHTLVVGIIARISGCQNQKELSLDDQVDHAEQVTADYYQGPADYRVIATKGKGERLDRPELEETEAMLRTGELDLLVGEDIGRLVRGTEAVRLCGIAVDHGTRVIAPNDCIDTAEDTWEEDVISACRDHVGHNSHTSKRLKHKLMNRFVKFGGATAREIFGYIKPPGVKTYAEWQKDQAATPIFQDWFEKLRQTPNCSAVADWLNQRRVPTGKYSRRKTWNGKMVRRITRNPLLKGMPGRDGFRRTVKHHETGRRVSVKNPDGPQFKEYPHLAHVDPLLWDEVNALLDRANAGCGRKPVNGVDPRAHVPRKRTRYPGQHVPCWYCGRQYVWGGNGLTENLMCNGAREWRCWNSIGFNGGLAARKLVEAIPAGLYRLDGFDEQFRAMVQEATRNGADLSQRWKKLRQCEETYAREKERFLAAITAYGPHAMLQQKLAELDSTGRELVRERHDLESLSNRALQLPESVTCLRQMLEEKFQELATDSPEFGELMKPLAPEFHVYLVRLCDGGHLLPRAKVKLALAGILPDAQHVSGLEELLTRELTLDLFEPPQRERIREAVVRLTAQGLKQREIVPLLPEKASQAVVQRALALDRQMRQRGLETPYVLVTEPPQDYAKLRRHKNPKYQFVPLEGYQPPAI